MSPIVHDRNRDGPMVFQGFRFGGGGNGFDIGKLKELFSIHRED
jgi:hypothetical protein